jgi:hypothetical protein
VTLRPRFFDRLYVTLLVLMAVGSAIGIGLSLIPQGPPHLHCERAANTCTMFWPSPMIGSTYDYDLSTLKNSRTYKDKGGTGWKVDWGARPLWLATSSNDPAAIAAYTRLAADFQAFLTDPSRPTFDGTYGAPPKPRIWIFILAFGLVCGYFGFRWWRGWYAEIELDSAARELTIHRRPMFFTGPRTKKYAASELRLSEHVDKRSLGRGQSAKFATFELRDAHGKRVFKYTTMYDGKHRAVLDGHMALLRDFFVGRA